MTAPATSDVERDRAEGLAFPFTHEHLLDGAELRALLGGKGASLHVMASVLGLPVPAGFTITTEACRRALAGDRPPGLDDQIARRVAELEATMGRSFTHSPPLLVSVRSGAPTSMPGMMDTILNLGLHPAAVDQLARETGSRAFALDCYRRFVCQFGVVVFGVPTSALEHRAVAGADGGASDAEELSAAVDRALVVVEAHAGRPFPTDPWTQLDLAVGAVFSSWDNPRARHFREREGLDDGLGTAVNVQAMVFGNRDDRSGTGVAFSRDPVSGAPGLVGDFQRRAQGDEVVGGSGHPHPLGELAEDFPDAWRELQRIAAMLERWYRDVVDIEFTIEQDQLWMLQSRAGKRSARARVRSLVDLAADGLIARVEAIAGVEPAEAERVIAELQTASAVEVAGRGTAASSGCVTGEAVFSADEAARAAEAGRAVVLIRPETSPEDVHGMAVAVGIATAAGGMVSHAAIVARAWGKPAVCGVEGLEVHDDHCTVGGRTIRQGEVVTVDGTAGVLGLGRADGVLAPVPEEMITLAAWSDDARGAALSPRAVAAEPYGAGSAGGGSATGFAHLQPAGGSAVGGERAVLAADDGRWEVVLLSAHGVDDAAALAAADADLAVLCLSDPEGAEADLRSWLPSAFDAKRHLRWELDVVQQAVGRLRARGPRLRIAAWGVLPSEVEQLAALLEAGVDEVWCPPAMLPAMQLATAQAAMATARPTGSSEDRS